MEYYQFQVDGRPVGPLRDEWKEAAADAVNNGYGVWVAEGASVRLNEQASVDRVDGPDELPALVNRNELPMADLVMLQAWAAMVMTSRPPDFIIGPEDNPYMRRWFIIPRNPFQNIYLHEVLRSDDDRAGHDHPWNNQTLVIDGGYSEQTYKTWKPWIADRQIERKPGDIITRTAEDTHRLIVPEGGRAVTLFTTGPRIREWGFWCPGDQTRGPRWVVWTDFTATDNKGLVGKGCGE